jgi:hypothetical protein
MTLPDKNALKSNDNIYRYNYEFKQVVEKVINKIKK